VAKDLSRCVVAWYRTHRLALLLSSVTVLVDLLLFSDLLAQPPGVPRMPPALTIGYGFVGYAALLFRERAPVATFLVLCIHATLLSLFTNYGPVLPICVALGTVAARKDLRVVVPLFAFALMPVAGWTSLNYRNNQGPHDLLTVALIALAHVVILLVACGIGWWQHLVRERRAAVAREAVANERLRIARELHDVVAHTVVLMILQAAGARNVMASDPARADTALALVEHAGTQAMDELRRLLAVLRGSSALNEQPPETDLQRGLADFAPLIATIEGTGIRVHLDEQGMRLPLDPSVDLTLYRILQEGLTNVTKHAGPGACATVGLIWGCDQLAVLIEDNGRGIRPEDPRLSIGHGLIGLTERVISVGGSLSFGPLPDGGFRLTANLPVRQLSDRDRSIPQGNSLQRI
jgi:signal transduction histidine kinase